MRPVFITWEREIETREKQMFKTLFGIASVFVIPVFTLVASSAIAGQPVKCQLDPTALQDAIDDANEGDEIKVIGDCVGNHVITTDGLIVSGQGGATITGTGDAPAITIAGADKVTLEGFAEINGNSDRGIVVRASGSAVVREISLITGSNGVFVTQSAFVEINGVDDIIADDHGIVADLNGSAEIVDSNISGNGRDGVHVAAGGAVNIAGGNTINNNGRHGIFSSGGQILFNGANTVQDHLDPNWDIRCSAFSRMIVTQSITSTSERFLPAGSGGVVQCFYFSFGEPVFVPPAS